CNGGGDVATEAGVEVVKARLDRAHRLGSRFMVMSIGNELTGAVRENLRSIADYAQNLNSQIAIETHVLLVKDAAGGIQTMERLDHPNIGINFDTANLYYYNKGIDALAELKKMVHYVNHVHLKDSNMGYQEWFFPAIGDGTVPLAEMIEVLE